MIRTTVLGLAAGAALVTAALAPTAASAHYYGYGKSYGHSYGYRSYYKPHYNYYQPSYGYYKSYRYGY